MKFTVIVKQTNTGYIEIDAKDLEQAKRYVENDLSFDSQENWKIGVRQEGSIQWTEFEDEIVTVRKND